ncbi:MAG: DUF5606 domain-containing protein [Bacteroidetes bacterium]|nr:DUF5606 domain-containing protein [Bacteroidota bacterium]
MELKKIVSISGRPGLFKIISQGKSNVIVESLVEKKRFPAFATEKISAVEDISILTLDEDVKLSEVFSIMSTRLKGAESIDHKSHETELRNTFATIVPNYDTDRVYLSDIKKVFQWYNLLLKEGILGTDDTATPDKEGEKSQQGSKQANKTKGDRLKKVQTVTRNESRSAKPAMSKRVPMVKTGSSRGK